MKHILIAYSWSVNNIGDIGITPGLLSFLRKTDPAMEAVVIASQESPDPALGFLREYLPNYLPGCGVIPNPFPSKIGAAGKSRAWEAFAARWGENKLESFRKGCCTSLEAREICDDILDVFSMDLYEEIIEDESVSNAFRNADFLLYNSGTTLNFGRLGVRDLWGYTLLWAMPLIIARRTGLPYGVNSQSVESVEWPVDLIYKKLIKDAEFFYCRDGDSLNYLSQRGLLNKNSGFRPDSTFFFKQFDDAWSEKFMRDNNLDEKRFICVIIRYPSDERKYHDPTGGSVSQNRRGSHMDKLRSFISSWIESTGMKVLICPETRDSIAPAKKHLYAKLSDRIKEDCVFMDDFWTSEQAYSVFRSSRIVVSMEMHSVIMALNVGTPVVHNPFAEAGRKKWMMKDTGFEDWLVDIDDVSAGGLLEAAVSIHKNYGAAGERIKRAMNLLEAKALCTVSEIKGVRGRTQKERIKVSDG